MLKFEILWFFFRVDLLTFGAFSVCLLSIPVLRERERECVWFVCVCIREILLQ